MMNKIYQHLDAVWIIFLLIIPTTCIKSRESYDRYNQLCVSIQEDSIQRCISCSDNQNKDIFLLLKILNLYGVVPDSSKYKGKPEQIITDSLGGGLSSVNLDGMVLYKDDSYYMKYEYNDIGQLKAFSSIDNSNPEDCMNVHYLYQGNKLKEVVAANHLGYLDDRLTFLDTLYKVQLIYKNNDLLDMISVEKDNINTFYPIAYR